MKIPIYMYFNGDLPSGNSGLKRVSGEYIGKIMINFDEQNRGNASIDFPDGFPSRVQNLHPTRVETSFHFQTGHYLKTEMFVINKSPLPGVYLRRYDGMLTWFYVFHNYAMEPGFVSKYGPMIIIKGFYNNNPDLTISARKIAETFLECYREVLIDGISGEADEKRNLRLVYSVSD
jgi:hypothetical protein